MKLTLKRTDFGNDGIFSILCDENDNVLFHTLEHSFDNKPKVYNGTFICLRGEHQLDHGGPFETFEITGVEGHSGILFHVGNFNKDSDGCVLLGKDVIQYPNYRIVSESKQAFQDFMNLMTGIDQFTLEVK